MIPKDYITAWRAHAPWRLDAQVEQDLVISRAIVDLFSVPELANSLVFRGGTALYKLYLTPAARYSEDIDLVQVRAESIGETLDHVRAALDPWLGVPRRVFKKGRVNLVYRFESEDAPPLRLRLKVEINTREHFTELGLRRVPFEIDSPWFSGSAAVSTYAIDELLCTKLRALYQRKKGRDLFDIWNAMDQGRIDPPTLLRCFDRYMAEEGHAITRAQFEANLTAKRRQPDFRDDMRPILRPGFKWDFDTAMDAVLANLVAQLPGEPWKGEEG
ncbi:MAG: nucleotidyl transferase AbiEii/AbiGii toxin family protein [Deltaproteobacteria bacterium]|nr:nucleotidyl transferase AbiEii/AbiGii toxin family protein [Deltaproteobacteria bacterium]